MQCRVCGTEIADKALICFRCGTATAEPRVPAPRMRQRSASPALLVLGVVLLALGVLFAMQGAEAPMPPAAAYALGGAGVAVLGWWVVRRR